VNFFHRFIFVLLVSLTLISANIAPANDIQAREYFVKAAFLYNFARLVEWPDRAFANDHASIRLCLIGNNPFGGALATISKKKVNERTLQISNIVNINNISQCHILFISQSEKDNVKKIISKTQYHAVLTVSELEYFAQNKGHIRLFLNSEKTLSLEVNLNAINQSGLKISSHILTLATIVDSDKELP